MRLVALLTILIHFTTFSQDTIDVELKKKIYAIYSLDQEVREDLRKFKNGELDSSTFNLDQIKRRISETDSLHFYKLESIIDEYGYPGYALVGKDFSDAFWNIVQHQDENIEFQERVLELMKKEVDKNNATKSYYAYLIDRVKVNQGDKQIYGSQMQLNSDSTSYEPKPVVDPNNLNERRKSVDLPPMEEYIETMNNRFFGTLKKD